MKLSARGWPHIRHEDDVLAGASLSARASTYKSWTSGRRFGIVVDAGSSGSRIQVYSWLDHQVAKKQRLDTGNGIAVLPKIEKGVEDGDGWTLKVEPGISSFGDHPEDVDQYLAPLFDHAKQIIPPSQLASTPVYVLATAGMRLLPEEKSHAVLARACRYIQHNTPFKLTSCEDDVRIISGEEEGVYGWVAINYLMDGFDAHGVADKGNGQHSSTYGFLDMGGASTQIAFEPSTEARKEHADNLLSVNLRLLDGMDVHHPVFVTTWLGYGTNQARERYVDASIAQHLRDHPQDTQDPAIGTEKAVKIIADPCLPKSLTLTEARHPDYMLQGTGDFAECIKKAAPLLNKELPCPDEPCLMGVHVPPIDFNVNHFIGISEYWYSTQELWSLGGVYDFPTFQKSAIDYCSQDWETLRNSYAEGGSRFTAGHRIPDAHRLEMQCFKAAWIVNVLHDGIGIPRLAVDRGGEGGKGNVTEEALEKAEQKGFAEAPSHFQSVDEINHVAVSWTLGRMVLEVTDSIPRSATAKAHHHDEASETPIFEWKHTGPDSWRHKLGASARRAYEHVNPLALAVLFLLAALLYYFRCSGKKGFSWRASSSKPGREEYGLVSMEEGAGQLESDDETSSSPRKASNIVARTVMPFRILASRASSLVRQHSTTSPSSHYLPVTHRSGTPARSPSPHATLPTARPVNTLRHVASSPALYRGSPPNRSLTLPHSSSATRLHLDLSANALGGNFAEAAPPPLTPPVRPGSPAWPKRMTASPQAAAKNGKSHLSRTNNSSMSDSEGYLSVPVGVSSCAPDTNVSSSWDSDSSSLPGANFGGALEMDDGFPGLRSRNSSYTNLGALARLRGGHSRLGSTEVA